MQSVVGQVWDAEPPFVGEVMVVITYYFKGGALDVDNMPKPILDALNGLVYADDRRITDLYAARETAIETCNSRTLHLYWWKRSDGPNSFSTSPWPMHGAWRCHLGKECN